MYGNEGVTVTGVLPTGYRVSFQDNLPIATLKNVCLVSIERNGI